MRRRFTQISPNGNDLKQSTLEKIKKNLEFL